MKKRLFALLLTALFLFCGACTPTAEPTPTPTPTLEVTPTPTATPTPTPTPTLGPTPTPEPSLAPVRHDWSGDGYSYTSKALGIRVEFPPQWWNYFDIVEEEKVIDTWEDEEGNLLEPRTVTILTLYPKDFVLEWEDGTVLSLASISFMPKGVRSTEDINDGFRIIMAETEEGTYRCTAWTMPQLELGPSGDRPVVTKEYVILETVQNGIKDGRWEIEVLDPKS